jgi:hypothetical protein
MLLLAAAADAAACLLTAIDAVALRHRGYYAVSSEAPVGCVREKGPPKGVSIFNKPLFGSTMQHEN